MSNIMWRSLGVAVICFLVVGCSTNPSITKTDSCTSFKRRDFPKSLALRSDAVASVNMRHEFLPPARFLNVSLQVPESLTQLGVRSIDLIKAEQSYPPMGACAPTSRDWQVCRLVAPERTPAGWSVLLVALASSSRSRILEDGEAYWLGIADCQ